MKKQYHYIFLIIFLLFCSSCSSRYGSEKPSLLLQNYEHPFSWAGITLGQSSLEETLEALESMDFVDVESIYQAEVFKDVDFGIYLDFQEGYRENGIRVWFIDDKAQVLQFSSLYTLSEIQENLGEVEKFVAYGWMHERPMLDYYGYSTSAAYVIRGGPSSRGNYNKLEQVTLNEDSIFFVYLINPDMLMYVLGVNMGTAKRDYVFSEGAFTDWHGYGDYEVVRAKYDLFMLGD